MLDHKCCRAESDYTADVCRRQPFLGDRKGKMKWKRSPGSAVIPFSLSFTPPPPLFFSLPRRQIRVISKERTFYDLAFEWQSKGGFETSENETDVPFSLRTSFFQVLSPTNAPSVPFRLIRSTIYNPHYYPNPGWSKLLTSPCGSFDSPWSGWSCFISPDLDHSNGTHQKITW